MSNNAVRVLLPALPTAGGAVILPGFGIRKNPLSDLLAQTSRSSRKVDQGYTALSEIHQNEMLREALDLAQQEKPLRQDDRRCPRGAGSLKKREEALAAATFAGILKRTIGPISVCAGSCNSIAVARAWDEARCNPSIAAETDRFESAAEQHFGEEGMHAAG